MRNPAFLNPSCFDQLNDEVNEEEVVRKASSEGSGDSSMFSSALAHIQSNSNKVGSDPKASQDPFVDEIVVWQHHEPISEDEAAEATEAHRKIYSERNSQGLNASSLGSAAALQVQSSPRHLPASDRSPVKPPTYRS